MTNKALTRLGFIVLPFVAYLLIRFIDLTMRITIVNSEAYRKLAQSRTGFILAFWHGRLLMMPRIAKDYGMTVLVSKSRDGELIARTIKPFGIDSVRGSSTRGWFGGIKGLLKAVRLGRNLAITPDGPQGPGRKVQTGIIQIAQKTGLPIVPVSFSSMKKKLLRAGTASLFHALSQKAYTYSAIFCT
ncbi:MAG: lysophospholipid acyltransferase family protein [Thermodesulfobacteriota bacterium]